MGWFWGEVGESCHVACARHNQICDEDWTRRNMLPDLQDYDEFIAATEQADHNSETKLDVADDPLCSDGTFELNPYDPWPLVRPNPSNYACGSSRKCTSTECDVPGEQEFGYECAMAQTGFAAENGYHRLCYCLPGALPSNLICVRAQTPSR